MIYSERTIDGVTLEISVFKRNDTCEMHLFAKNQIPGCFENQLSAIHRALRAYFLENNIPADSAVFCRYFVSDFMNQQTALVKKGLSPFPGCSVSVVQQPPLSGGRIAAWVYAIQDKRGQEILTPKVLPDGDVLLKRGIYSHLWSTQLMSGNGAVESFKQTNNIFSAYAGKLSEHGFSLKDNCIRTWLFVKDIDYNYQGLVDARRAFFETCGMTKDTHFIASTGIEGRHADPKKSVLMDAYCIGGLVKNQVRFLKAPENMNPSYEYGVTFERGTSVDFGDRRHIFISGTASIDHKGEILHRNDAEKQVRRTIDNISALLGDADATLSDVAQMIVYLRDISDTVTVERYFSEHYRDIPKVVVLAPVCRPGWLVEIECIAVKAIENPAYALF
jgi:enamine deaminase RidA (YjgF/YER057c/UK114 family)